MFGTCLVFFPRTQNSNSNLSEHLFFLPNSSIHVSKRRVTTPTVFLYSADEDDGDDGDMLFEELSRTCTSPSPPLPPPSRESLVSCSPCRNPRQSGRRCMDMDMYTLPHPDPLLSLVSKSFLCFLLELG